MSKTKAKIASKNNPTTRGVAKEYLYGGQKIKPVKLITDKGSFFGAEFDGSGDVVLDKNGRPLPWKIAKIVG